jgi:hypothetical protein
MTKSKVKSELRKLIEFSVEERKKIVEEYLRGGVTKNEIWYKYTGRFEEHGKLLIWMRELGYATFKKEPKLASKTSPSMAKNFKCKAKNYCL